jgi:hypothetical protein
MVCGPCGRRFRVLRLSALKLTGNAQSCDVATRWPEVRFWQAPSGLRAIRTEPPDQYRETPHGAWFLFGAEEGGFQS